MPTTAIDRKLLALAVVVFTAGCALIALGVILDPPTALLRHLTKEQ